MQTNKEIETILHCSFKNYKKLSKAYYLAISENKTITVRTKHICLINIWYFLGIIYIEYAIFGVTRSRTQLK